MVSHHFGISVDKLKDRKGEPREIAIYLLKTHTDMKNRQIGEFFGGLSYSAVEKVIGRFSAKVNRDRKLRNKLAVFSKIISNIKG